MLASFEWLDKALGAKVAIRELASGEELFSQGARARAIFALESGRLRLLRRTVAGHLVVLHRARAGELFAEAAFFSETYHCDAVAAVHRAFGAIRRAMCWPPSAHTRTFANGS